MPTTDELIDESIEGKHARREGALLGHCPHPLGSSLGNAWRRGWVLEDRLSNLHPAMAAALAPFVVAAE
jgi:hypothetical protein